jgi:hypothetical protein
MVVFMDCKEAGCKGKIVNGSCAACGAPESGQTTGSESSLAANASAPNAPGTAPRDEPICTDDLVRAAKRLDTVLADDYSAWREQADLLLGAIRQLETRHIEPDESIKIIGVPLRESALRAKAEEVLRNCAHFAQNFEERVSLIDEANRIRRTTWF